jgi:hypothetical protein
MVEVEFIFQQNSIIIQAFANNSFQEIVNKFIMKTQLDINNLYFLSNGKTIDMSEILGDIMNESEKKNKKIIILVYTLNSTIKYGNTNMKQSNDIICPECKEICKYEIKNYKIELNDCINGHKFEKIKLNEFFDTQIIDISKIKCDKCKKNNKFNTFNNEFFICYKCKMNLCPLCKSIHEKKHTIINYDNINYFCNKHN